jgi:site-specific recombinase XerD
MSALAPVLEGFFVERLAQRGVSAHTVACYRDCFRLLLRYAQRRTAKAPASLDLADLDAELVAGFLDHLEADRGNGIVTRNLRLTAIHSFFTYAALRCPEHAATISRVLALPAKRRRSIIVDYLTADEVDALLAAPDRTTSLGRRDHLLLLVATQTGLRVSELTGLTCRDVAYGPGAHLYTCGKGRKDRRTPLTASTARLLQDWVRQRHAGIDDPLFPTVGDTTRPLSTDAVEDLVDKHVAAAAANCPSLAAKRVTPHTLRHTCAMNLLHHGVDQATIALWLGHANTRATDIYLHADMAAKEKALARTAPTPAAARRYRPPDKLLAFLESL